MPAIGRSFLMLFSLIPVIAIEGCKPTGAVPASQQLVALSNMMAITAATNAYCVANGEAMPPDLQTLVTAGFLPASTLNSPFGPVSDGGPDYSLISTDLPMIDVMLME